ncbi:MAG: phage tail protein [Cyanobacteria bacterium P01_C01_bin.72]
MTEITQAREQQQVALKLRSLNIPEAELALLPIRTGSTPKTINLKRESLLLNPGAKSQMYVRLVNRGGAPLNLRWEVAGDFPLAWHQVDSSEAQLLPGEATEVILNFLVPDDFFEAEDALTSNTENWRNRSLQLDYYGKLHLYTSRDTEESVQTTGFNLFVRPNTRYLDFLPQIYREVDFIGRFLKIIETTFEPDLQILESFWAYLDPLTAPESMLPFLAHWVGWELEPNIPTRLQRRLIRYAMQIYRWRGTRHGLRFFLHLLTGLPLDEHISIRESFSRGFIFGETRLGEDAILGGGKPFHFSVHLRRDLPERQLNEEVIRLVIDREKPAFCTYDLEIED